MLETQKPKDRHIICALYLYLFNGIYKKNFSFRKIFQLSCINEKY